MSFAGVSGARLALTADTIHSAAAADNTMARLWICYLHACNASRARSKEQRPGELIERRAARRRQPPTGRRTRISCAAGRLPPEAGGNQRSAHVREQVMLVLA